MVRPVQRKSPASLTLAPWMGLILLALGVGIGWAVHGLLSRNESETVAECPKLPEPAPAPVCPSPADAEPAAGERLPVYASEVTGEGVIEFKFYGPDGTEITRKWITRIPLSAPAEAPADAETPAPAESATNRDEKTDSPEAKKPSAKAPEADAKSETKPSTKPAASTKGAEKKSPAKPAGKGKYTVQTGAYKDRESAEQQVSKLERRGFDARIEKAAVPGKGVWYRVRVGSSLTQSEAGSLASKIRKSAGLEASAVVQ